MFAPATLIYLPKYYAPGLNGEIVKNRTKASTQVEIPAITPSITKILALFACVRHSTSSPSCQA